MFICFKKSSLLCLLAALSLASPLTMAAFLDEDMAEGMTEDMAEDMAEQMAEEMVEQLHPINKQLDACIDKNRSNAGMIGCYEQAEKRWDNELNKLYKALLSKLNPEGKESLEQSQKQWLKYRDAEFKTIRAIYSTMEGRMWNVIAVASAVEIIEDRVLTLKAYLDDLNS
jgi:uncharacterized protein YecT (DUF1311 family)